MALNKYHRFIKRPLPVKIVQSAPLEKIRIPMIFSFFRETDNRQEKKNRVELSRFLKGFRMTIRGDFRETGFSSTDML